MVPTFILSGSWERLLADQNMTTGVKIARLLRALDSARRNASLYPDNHPRLEESLRGLKELIGSLSVEGSPIKLTMYREECFLNGESSEEELDIPLGFSDRFLRLGLASVTFPPNTDNQELLGFLRFLGSDPRDADHGQDFKALAQLHRLGNIEIEALDYSKLFLKGIGLPAELDDRDDEQFARLLTLWDPYQNHRSMTDDEIKALTRLSEDSTAMKKLMELSMRGSEEQPGGQAPVEGTVASLGGLAERLRDLFPERWETVSRTLVRAALSLDSELLRQKRPDLMLHYLVKPGERQSVAKEMDEDELAAVIAEALAAKKRLYSSFATVIRDLVPERHRRNALEPLIAGELKALGVRPSRRERIKTWWKELVMNAQSEDAGTDAFISSLVVEPVEEDVLPDAEQSSLGAWFKTSSGDSVLLSHYFDDLRGVLGLENKPEDLHLVLGSYQKEFQNLAESGDLARLREAIDELSGELTRCGRPVAETLKPVLSVALIAALSDVAVGQNSEQRSQARAIAHVFGPAGFRVVMKAIGKTTHWEIIEELRTEIHSYGSEVVDELLKWLSHSEVRVAKEALLLVRKVGDERTVSKIEPLLNHSDAEYRAAALATLSKIGGSRRYNAIEKGLMDRSAIVVDVALDAAAEFGAESFLAPLARLLLSHRQDTEFHLPRAKAIRLVGNRGLSQLVDELQEIVKGAGSWIRFTRDEPLVPYAVRALLQLDSATGRAFVKNRARWWRGRRVRDACKQALREVAEKHE